MSQPPEPSPRVPKLDRFRVGAWSVHQAENTLSTEGRTLHLEPRVMDVLVYLASEAERVVPKEELLEAVWGGAFIEEGALSQAVHSLRKALGDDARQPQYIQTIPKRGYRLVAPVVPEEGRTSGTGVHAVVPPRLDLMASSPALVVAPAPVPLRLPRRSRLLMATAGIAAAVALWFAWEKLRPMGEATRIVVLPFENMGKPEDDYFADGLTEEITKDLASLHSLEVISRTTAILYEGAQKPLPEIGRELGVHYVLEGTVRWALGPGGRRIARITPQLIRVADDAHVWAASFDREVQDIFEVQAEISQKVIRALGITLLPGEKETQRSQPTENLDAFRAYMRGLQVKSQPVYSEEYLRKAVPLFERAVFLDSGFASAWAELSQTHSYLAFNSDRSPVRMEKARQAMERAMALAPELPEVRLAQAHYTYRCLEDFDTALEQLTTASRLFPNDAGVLQTFGYVLRRKGRLEEAIQVLRQSASLNPRFTEVVWTIADTYRALRDYKQADLFYRQVSSLAPDEPSVWAERALNWLAWTGELKKARALLEQASMSETPEVAAAAFQFDLYEREYLQALNRLSAEQLKTLPLQDQSRLESLAVLAHERLGNRQLARKAAEANRMELRTRIARFPKEPLFRAYLAVALAQLGREAEAVGQIEQAVRLKRHDALTGPRIIQIQAMVEATLGRRREAIGRLALLLDTPYRTAISTAELRLDPVWDPLRGDPAFESLLWRSEH